MRIVLVLMGSIACTSCATSQLTAFRDPGYPARRFDRLAVFAFGMELANAVEVERQVCLRVAPAPCVEGKRVLPPTRTYTADEATDLLTSADVDGVLVIALVGDETDSRYLGSIASATTQASASSRGSINLYGNSALWNGSSQSITSTTAVATPMYQDKRVAFAQVGLFERATGNVAWRGELKVSGQGSANTTDKVFIKSATNKLAEALRTNNLVR